eukprot:3507857-Prorocentrum_lima.AAC.1
MATLLDYGWKPAHPDVWVDSLGCTWKLFGPGQYELMLCAFKQQVHNKIWLQASQLPGGAGLQFG